MEGCTCTLWIAQKHMLKRACHLQNTATIAHKRPSAGHRPRSCTQSTLDKHENAKLVVPILSAWHSCVLACSLGDFNTGRLVSYVSDLTTDLMESKLCNLPAPWLRILW